MHLLVTNDYPPKVGGIQSYLWELYRRLPADDVAVLTSPHDEADMFDHGEGYQIERHQRFWLTPTPDVRGRVEQFVASLGASFVMIDPAVPLGLLGPQLSVPYGLFIHGTEATIPARTPGLRTAQRRAVEGARTVVSSSAWASEEMASGLGVGDTSFYLPPGVDTERFRPLFASERTAVRSRFGLPPNAPVVLGLSRLVRRKGLDVLIEATGRLSTQFPHLHTVIVGSGRDERRLRRLAARSDANVMFLGEVEDTDLPNLYGASDIFAMPCRNRWNGLEQEGFGIVFVEAAACGIPAVAGRSGGSAEAVQHDATGLVVRNPDRVDELVLALEQLLESPAKRSTYGAAGRRRAEEQFSWDHLAQQYRAHLDDAFSDVVR